MRSTAALFSAFIALFAAVPLQAETKSPASTHLAAGDLVISQIWSRATPPTAKSGVAYLQIENTGTSDDALLAVSSTVANNAMIHETKVADGVMTMSHVMKLAIAAGETVKLEPGGLHVMLMGLKAPLKAATSYKLTLTFETAGEVTIDVPVLSPGQPLKHSH